MVRWSIMVVVGSVLVLVGVLVGVGVLLWWRTPARVEYRVDRRTLRRLRRRWRRLERAPITDEESVRRLEHRLELAAQGCRARRRNTGFVRWVRDRREPRPVRLEIPFERRYLLDACILLDHLAATLEPALADVVDVRDARAGTSADEAVAEPA